MAIWRLMTIYGLVIAYNDFAVLRREGVETALWGTSRYPTVSPIFLSLSRHMAHKQS